VPLPIRRILLVDLAAGQKCPTPTATPTCRQDYYNKSLYIAVYHFFPVVSISFPPKSHTHTHTHKHKLAQSFFMKSWVIA